MGVAMVATLVASVLTGQTLQLRHTNPAQGALRAITAGPAGLVAVGEGGQILTSIDGRAWTAQNSPTKLRLNSVTFGDGRYVAVGDGGIICESTGGVKWNSGFILTGPEHREITANYYAITYSGAFVVVGEGGTILRWTSAWPSQTEPSPTTQTLRSVSPGTPGATWFTSVGAAGTVISNYTGTWEIIRSSMADDLEAITPAFHSYFVSSGGLNYAERWSALAGGARGQLFDIGRRANLPTNAPVVDALPSPTATRIKCVVSGGLRFVEPWRPEFASSHATYATAFVLVDEDGQVFWSTQSASDAIVRSGWMQIGRADRAVHGAVWCAEHQAFYLVGDNQTVIAAAEFPPWGLANASVRGFVSAPQGPLIAGIVVPGEIERSVLVRGIGAGLRRFGVSTVLGRPRLTIFRGSVEFANATELAADPRASLLRATGEQLGAFPMDENDSAILVRLSPGTWTAVLASADGGSGAALIETYLLP